MIRLGPDWQRLMEKYELAHQDPRNQACHAIGIPMIAASLPISATLVGLPLGASMFTVGWGFQFLGHWFEGTDPEFLSDKRSLVIGLIWWLKKRGIELICPHRSNRKRPSLQDGRSLRRYRRRWTIERTVAWLGNFRRLVVRYERKSKMFLAFLKVACLMITLRQF